MGTTQIKKDGLKVRTVNFPNPIDIFLVNCVKVGMAPSVAELLRIVVYGNLPKLVETFKTMVKLNETSPDKFINKLKQFYNITRKNGRKKVNPDPMGNPYWNKVMRANGEIVYTRRDLIEKRC